MESWRTLNDIADARKEVEWKGLVGRLDKIDSNVSRVFWLFFAGIITGVAAFVTSGGLHVTPL